MARVHLKTSLNPFNEFHVDEGHGLRGRGVRHRSRVPRCRPPPRQRSRPSPARALTKTLAQEGLNTEYTEIDPRSTVKPPYKVFDTNLQCKL